MIDRRAFLEAMVLAFSQRRSRAKRSQLARARDGVSGPSRRTGMTRHCGRIHEFGYVEGQNIGIWRLIFRGGVERLPTS